MENIDRLGPAYHRVIERNDIGLRGYVVIDSFLDGHGTGGVRMGAHVTLEEIANLAREMSLKFAWLDIPTGGAKAGIVAPTSCPHDQKLLLCKAFGEEVADMIRDGRYVAGQDMGIGKEELAAILAAAGAPQQTASTDLDSNYYTALSVFISACVAMQARGVNLNGATVLLEGLGKVGSHLVRLLDAAGARLVGVSTALGAYYEAGGIDAAELLRLRSIHGDECVRELSGGGLLQLEELFEKRADLLVPGAAADSINPGNVDRIDARFIIPIANICASEAIETRLAERGILYLPGFVTNCGGVFCWYLARLEASAREEMMRIGFARKVRRLIARADGLGQDVATVARGIAASNARRMAAEERGTVGWRIAAFLRKLTPKRLGYVVVSRLLGASWQRRPTRLCRWYYDSRYFG
jgi:glutamate dehydrogenase (NAD(P)+)